MTRRKTAMFAAGACWLFAMHAFVHAGQAGTRTTLDGVYSTSQAARGQALYAAMCANCHRLDGVPVTTGSQVSRALTGREFVTSWSDVSVAALFMRVRSSMPPDNPASLSRNQAADVVGYLLQMNGFPPGDAELPSTSDLLNQITFVAR